MVKLRLKTKTKKSKRSPKPNLKVTLNFHNRMHLAMVAVAIVLALAIPASALYLSKDASKDAGKAPTTISQLDGDKQPVEKTGEAKTPEASPPSPATSKPKKATPASPPPSTPSPCQGAGETAHTTTCTITAKGDHLDIFGVPVQQSGPYGSTLSQPVGVKCSLADTCSFEGTAFTEKVFTQDDFTPTAQDYNDPNNYHGLIRIDTTQAVQITVTVAQSMQTSYLQPYPCRGCPATYTNHVFNLWTHEDLASAHNYQRLVANYTSTKKE